MKFINLERNYHFFFDFQPVTLFIGVIYECAPCNSMTTTHDKEYTVGNFPGKRTIPRSDYQSDKAPITTMKKDFDYKKVAEKAQPYRPPGTTLIL